jgi:DNA-binding PadR family transcriptional regulator
MSGRRSGHEVLSLGEHAVLALLVEQPRHGWAIVRELAPDGEVGRVWTLSRPLAYRAMDTLTARRLVRPTGTEQAGGPRRTILGPTAAGRREVDRWLATPVAHPRDVRTELLVKLVLAPRLGIDPRPLVRAQRRAFKPVFGSLARAAAAPGADVVDQWRHQSALAIARFLDHLLASPAIRARSSSTARSSGPGSSR